MKSMWRWNLILPFYDGVIRPHTSRQQVVPVVEQLVVFAAVSHPHVRHTRHPAGQTQQILSCTTVLVCDEQTLVSCLTLKKEQTGKKDTQSAV